MSRSNAPSEPYRCKTDVPFRMNIASTIIDVDTDRHRPIRSGPPGTCDHGNRSPPADRSACPRYHHPVNPTPTQPSAPLPPAVRRYELWIAAVFICTTLAAVATPFVLRRVAPWISPLWALPGIPLAIVTTTLGTIWYSRRATARIRRAVQAASGRACLACVYDLNGMGATGACPECGRRFDIAADRRSWEQARML